MFLKSITILVIILFNILEINSQELISEDFCEADDIASAMSTWYSQIYNFVQTNQNLSQQITKNDENCKNSLVEVKNEVVQLKSQLQRVDAQLTAMQQKLHEQQQQLLQSIGSRNNNPQEIVIQRRQDGSVDFYRTWNEYKQGFGNTTGEFFIGLDQLHRLTSSRPHALLIILEDWDNERRYAKYDNFVVGSEAEKYELKQLGAYSGTAGDSLSYHLQQKFSTKDQQNDGNAKDHCAQQYKGAWWYKSCHYSNLNGLYIKRQVGDGQWAAGVHWYAFKGHGYSLKFSEMILIRQ